MVTFERDPITIATIISGIYYIVRIIAGWKVFSKAGESGWKSLIPIYNMFVQYGFSWKVSMAVVYLVLAVVGGVFREVGGIGTAVSGLALLAMYIVDCIGMHKLSKSFGHSVGFTLGLIILQPIFIMILAFGSSKYIGNTSE